MLQRKRSTVFLSFLAVVALGGAVTNACPEHESCLSTFMNATKSGPQDTRNLCLASEKFLMCADEAQVTCSLQGHNGFQGTIAAVRSRVGTLCAAYITPTPASESNSCPALLLCQDELSQSMAEANSLVDRCSVHKKYVTCAREAAETCGVISNPAVVASLNTAEKQYRDLCPDKMYTTATDATVTEGIFNRTTRQVAMTCPQFTACHTAMTEAMKDRDIGAVCKSMANFVTCAEETKKACNIPTVELQNALAHVKNYLASPACKDYVQPRLSESLGASETEIPMADASYNPTNSPKRSIMEQADEASQAGCGSLQKCILDGREAMKAAGRDLSKLCTELEKTKACMHNAMSQCEQPTEQNKELIQTYDYQLKQSCPDSVIRNSQTTMATNTAGQGGSLDPNCAELERCLAIKSVALEKELMCKSLAQRRNCIEEVATRCSQHDVIKATLRLIQTQEAEHCGVTTTTTTSSTTTTTSTTTTPDPTMPETDDPRVSQTSNNNANSLNEARELSGWPGYSSAPSQLLTSPVLLLCCAILALFS